MRRLFVLVALIALLPGLWMTGRVLAAGDKKQPQSGAAQTPGSPNASDFVGSDTCATCHGDIAKKFGTNPHSRLALMHGGNGVTCESCHGPGKAHVDGGGDITKIFRFSKASAKLIDDKCLGCHASAHPNFERSDHGKAGVSCTSCHSVHAFESEASLLKVSQPKLCYTCHTDIKPEFSQPFHHRVDEGLITCSDCHDPHGTFQSKAAEINSRSECHMHQMPYRNSWSICLEHPVIKTEGCTSCHSPHGSQNARLLNVSNINTLCLQCHSGTNMSAFPHAVSPTGPVHNQAAQYVACTNCHTQIHGSNASNIFFK